MTERKSMSIKEMHYYLDSMGYAKFRDYHVIFAPMMQLKKCKKYEYTTNFDHIID